MPSPKLIDMTNWQFGRLTVLDYVGKSRWRCRCECGQIRIIWGSDLRNDTTKSCGCWRRDNTIARNYKHGHATRSAGVTKENIVWGRIKQRCYNSKTFGFKDYGGRGIKVCDRWLESFENFLADMGNAPSPKHTLDRLNNDGDYEPGNCRWATQREQNRNMRSNRRITINGETLVLEDWLIRLNMSRSTFYGRTTKRGMSAIEALTTPVDKRYSRYG